MICEKCGLSYEGNFCPNGCNSPMAKKPKKSLLKRWWFWVLIVLVAIMFFSCIGAGSEDTPASEPANDNEAIIQATEDVTEATPVANETTAAEETEAPQATDNVYTVGSVIDNYGLLITYESAEIWNDYNKYGAPEDGYQYIRLFLSAENTGNADTYISFAEFDCYVDGTKVESYFGGDDRLDGGTLSSGRKAEGYIYFVIPVDAEEIEVEYELNMWTDERAILKVAL